MGGSWFWPRESGLLGTRQALELLRLREQEGFSIVALGDDKRSAGSPAQTPRGGTAVCRSRASQYENIRAGAIIELSRLALGADQVPQTLTSVRQQTERERRIVGLLREGRAAGVLDLKRAEGTAEIVPGGYDGVVARVAGVYAERLKATGEAPTISTPRNSDAHRISAEIRRERRVLGELGPDRITVQATDGERNYALALTKGDRDRLSGSTGSTYEKGRGGGIGRIGSVLDVITADQDGLTLRANTGKVAVVKWSDLRHSNGRLHLAYGDAMTVHRARSHASISLPFQPDRGPLTGRWATAAALGIDSSVTC